MNGMATQKKQEAPLLPVYLIVGEDALKRDTVMKRLRARLSALGDLSFNADEFNGETALGGDVVAACNTVPFASPVRLVEVRAADKLKKADAEALVSYLSSPSGSTVLALVAEKLAKNTRLYKAVAAHGKTAVIDCAPLKRNELPKTVRAMAAGHGVTLTEGAARALVDLVGENTVHLDSELKKIALAHRGTDAVNELADEPSARSILITHSASYKTSFAYNSWNRNYKMSMYSNRTKKFEAAVDELTGKQLTFANVVVCFANIAAYAGDSHDVQEVQYVEGGQAYLFTSGGVQTGRWEKDHPTHPIRLYTDAGEEMTLNRGKTYFALVDNDEWSNFSYQ